MHRTVPGFRTLHFGDVVDRTCSTRSGTTTRSSPSSSAGLLVQSVRRGRRPRLRFAWRSRWRLADALIKLAFRRDPDGDEPCWPRPRTIDPGVPAPQVNAVPEPPSLRGTPARVLAAGRSGTLARSMASSSRGSTRCSSSTCSHSSPALAWRNQTRSPIRSSSAAGPASGVCTSPAPSAASSARPAGRTGPGQAAAAGPVRRRSSRRRARWPARGRAGGPPRRRRTRPGPGARRGTRRTASARTGRSRR